MTIESEVVRSGLTQSGSGSAGRLILGGTGELFQLDPYLDLVKRGLVYMASNAAIETAEAIGNGAFADTEPAICIDVPDGKTLVPLDLSFKQAGTVASGTFTGLIVPDVIKRITSGVNVTLKNRLVNASAPSGHGLDVKKHIEGTTNLVCIANSEDRAMAAGLFPGDLDALEGGHLRWNIRKDIPIIIKGPGSLAVHLYVTTQEPECFWYIILMVIDSTLWALPD